ncbi:leader peptidase (prepilin peptidase)/N-methyltransferase [Streptomyces sp. SAI-133]|uniref:prepilin peptidase n=1 Tax=unclassified Streptomyces TaxID=2593676 RepID=UPI002476B7C5|nr:A24 family peptidase [Streptomyces sp. SAI-133]MDH6580902.1 leader peptidase (prepilin peptidase)/N-methyltransferase [Streptomyces sp. SAI-133]
MQKFWIIAAAVLWGAGTGLFIPRAAYRLSVPPEAASRTTCPAGHAFTGLANGWLGRARCTDGDAYGPSTTALSAISAAVCAVLAAAVGDHPELVVWLLLIPIGVLLATVDLMVQRLPDVLTLPLAVISLVLLAVAAQLPGADGGWRTALLGSVVLGSFCVMLLLSSPASFGFGDVKLALTIGAVTGWYGWGILLAGTFAGFVLFTLYGLSLMAARRAHRTTALPLGPFLLAGAGVGVLLGSVH